GLLGGKDLGDGIQRDIEVLWIVCRPGCTPGIGARNVDRSQHVRQISAHRLMLVDGLASLYSGARPYKRASQCFPGNSVDGGGVIGAGCTLVLAKAVKASPHRP